MKILWIAVLPAQVQTEALHGVDHGARHAAPWITAHLPPPPGIDLHVACLWPGGTVPKAVPFCGATFHLVPCPRRGRLATLYLFDDAFYRRLVRELNPDVIHGWGTEESNGLVAVRLAPRRHVVGIQGVMNAINARGQPGLRDRLSAGIERLTLARARCVVAESRFAADAAGRFCRRTVPRVVPQPVRPEILEAAMPGTRARRAVFLGRIARQKGIEDAVAAFSRAASPGWTLDIVGGATPRERETLERLLAEGGISGRAAWRQNLTGLEVADCLGTAAVLLLPTWADSGPTALKEALCMGVWPVCYDNTGPGELIRAFGFGELARDRDRDHLAAVLKRDLECEPWNEPGRRAACVARAREMFSRARAWDALAALYREVQRD